VHGDFLSFFGRGPVYFFQGEGTGEGQDRGRGRVGYIWQALVGRHKRVSVYLSSESVAFFFSFSFFVREREMFLLLLRSGGGLEFGLLGLLGLLGWCKAEVWMYVTGMGRWMGWGRGVW
jgi:hypothetical protein